jgi:thioredoxin-like negative regulator of GroEL
MLYFKKTILFCFFIFAGFCFPIFGVPPQSPNLVEADDSDFDILIENGYSLVNFYDDSSKPSQKFNKTFEHQSWLFDGIVSFIYVNVDYSFYTIEKYDIFEAPTVILFKDGFEIKRNVGQMNMRELYFFILTGIH